MCIAKSEERRQKLVFSGGFTGRVLYRSRDQEERTFEKSGRLIGSL